MPAKISMDQIRSFLHELLEILEDIKNNKSVNPYDCSNGFTDTFTLYSEIEYLKEIGKKLEENKKTKAVEKILDKCGEGIGTDEFVRLMHKSGKVSQILQNLKGASREINVQNRRIKDFETQMSKTVEMVQSRYNAMKHIHIWLIKRLIGISQDLEELKEQEIADWELSLVAALNCN